MNKFLVIFAVSLAAALSFGQGHTKGHFQFQGSDGGSLVQLAQRPEVQKELKVTASQKAKLTDLENRLEDAVMSDFKKDLPTDKMRTTVMNTGNGFADELPKILTPAQNKRLLGLLIQKANYSALERDDVQKDLGFSKAQKGKVDAAQADLLKSFDAVQTQKNKNAAMLMVRSAMARHAAALKAIMTKSQEKKFEAMKGKPFTFAPTAMPVQPMKRK